MTNEPTKIHQETNLQKIGNLIKIPYFDLIEDIPSHPPFFINGFSITEIDETNEDLFQDEDILDIETKKGFQLKRKAETIENYYMNYSEEELSNVHCSICYMNCFGKNELLYFKDKKSLISYLKYCFIFLKKNIFTNHRIYMNNRYDLFKIDHTYYIGFHFLIPKTICKACFIQLINKEFLLSKLKNEISDYDGDNYLKLISPKKNDSLLRQKKRRKEKKIKANEKKEKKDEKENNNKDEIESALKSIQISPIVIPLSNNDTPIKKIKRRKIIKFGMRKRRKKDNKKKNKILNDDVIYDLKNNTIIINKKILENFNLNESQDGSIKEQIESNKTIKQKEEMCSNNKKKEINKIGANFKLVKCDNINIYFNKDNKNIKVKKEKSVANKATNTSRINLNNISSIQTNNINNIINNPPNIFSQIKQFIFPNYYMNIQKINNDLNDIFARLKLVIIFCYKIRYNIIENSNMKNEINKRLELIIFKLFEEINNKIYENRILIEYSFLVIKKYIDSQICDQAKEIKICEELNILFQISMEINLKYQFFTQLCMQGFHFLKNIIEEKNNEVNIPQNK